MDKLAFPSMFSRMDYDLVCYRGNYSDNYRHIFSGSGMDLGVAMVKIENGEEIARKSL